MGPTDPVGGGGDPPSWGENPAEIVVGNSAVRPRASIHFGKREGFRAFLSPIVDFVGDLHSPEGGVGVSFAALGEANLFARQLPGGKRADLRTRRLSRGSPHGREHSGSKKVPPRSGRAERHQEENRVRAAGTSGARPSKADQGARRVINGRKDQAQLGVFSDRGRA